MRTLLLCSALLFGCDTGSSAKASANKAASSKQAAGQKKAGGKKSTKGVQKTASTSKASGHQLPGYVGTFKNDPKLSPERVASWKVKQLRIKRNEVYARYGRAFQSADLQAHFGRQSWYTAKDSYSDSMLTDNDRANVALIKSFEGEPKRWDGQVGALMFMDRTSLVISDTESLYGHEGEERHYVARGTKYVITWSGPATFDVHDAAVSEAELWTWTGSGWTRTPIKVANG